MDEQIQAIKAWLGSGSVNIFGPQFSGKDTQCDRLVEYFGGAKLSSGAILRAHHEENKHLAEEMNTGNLAPTDDFRDIVLPYFSREEFGDQPLFLSSVGRMHGEEDSVMKATENGGHPIKAVIFLKLSKEETLKRYKAAEQLHDRGRRADDSIEGLMTRLDKFHDETLPVIEYYRQKGLLIEINGNKSRDAVTEDIITALAEKANQ